MILPLVHSAVSAVAIAAATSSSPAGPLPPASPVPGTAWVGATASPDARGVLAVWNRDEIALSKDDGQTFASVLRGRGTIRSAALNEAGDLFVLRSDRLAHARGGAPGSLEVIERSGGRRSHPLPEGLATDLFVSGRTVGVVLAGDDEWSFTFAVSRDGGQTFAEEGFTVGNAGFAARIQHDGTISTMTGHEASCGGGGQVRERRSASGEWSQPVWSLDAPLDWGLGADDFAYGVDDCTEGHAPGSRFLCAAGEHDVTAILTIPPGTDQSGLQVSTNGRNTLALVGSYLLELGGRRGRIVDTRAPADLWLSAVDADGRAIGLAARGVVRWSPSTGWQDLAVGADPAK